MSKEREKQKDGATQQWPFELVGQAHRLMIAGLHWIERVQKPTGGGPKGQPPHSPTKQE